MRRLLYLIAALLSILTARADDNESLVHVYYNDTLMATYLRADIDSVTYVDSIADGGAAIVLHRIHMGGEVNDYVLSEIDSVVLTRPDQPDFFWAQSLTDGERTYLSATLRGKTGGHLPSWSGVERGFIVTDKRFLLRGDYKLVLAYPLNGSGEYELQVSNPRHGIKGDKTYYYRAYARVGGILHLGSLQWFRLMPVVIWTDTHAKVDDTPDANERYQATVSANVYGDTKEIKTTMSAGQADIGFYYDKEDDMPARDKATSVRQAGYFNEVSDIEAVLTKLEPGTKYYYRPFTEIADTIYYGIPASFWTPPGVSVTSREPAPSGIGATHVDTSYDIVVKTSGEQISNAVYGVQYSTTPDLDALGDDTYYNLGDPTQDSETLHEVSFIKLKPGTTYYYRAYAVVNGKMYKGNTVAFTTRSDIPINTYAAESVTDSSAYLSGELVEKEAINEGELFGFFINTEGNPTEENAQYAYDKFVEQSDGTFYWTPSELTPGTKYFYRAFITYNDEIYYGNVQTFTTDGTQAFYGELGLFELKGHVRSCTYTNLYSTVTRTFDQDGFWLTNNGKSLDKIYSYGILRDENGRIIEGGYDEGGNETYEYDGLGRRASYTDILWDGGETHTYTYNEQGLLIQEVVEMEGMDIYWNDNYTLTYSDYVFDAHGNWTSRTRHSSSDGDSTETRVITYY